MLQDIKKSCQSNLNEFQITFSAMHFNITIEHFYSVHVRTFCLYLGKILKDGSVRHQLCHFSSHLSLLPTSNTVLRIIQMNSACTCHIGCLFFLFSFSGQEWINILWVSLSYLPFQCYYGPCQFENSYFLCLKFFKI